MEFEIAIDTAQPRRRGSRDLDLTSLNLGRTRLEGKDIAHRYLPESRGFNGTSDCSVLPANGHRAILFSMSENLPARMAGGPGMRGPASTVTPRQARERRVAFADLLSSGLSSDELYATMADKFGMGEAEVDRLAEKVKAQLKTEYEEGAILHKAAASRRLHRHIVSAAAAKQYSAVAQLESQLSKIQGTESPTEQHITVDAKMQAAVMTMLSTSSPTQIQELVNEELRRMTPATPPRPQLSQATDELEPSST